MTTVHSQHRKNSIRYSVFVSRLTDRHYWNIGMAVVGWLY